MKREVIAKATKRAYREARRAGKPIPWSVARQLGTAWAHAMHVEWMLVEWMLDDQDRDQRRKRTDYAGAA